MSKGIFNPWVREAQEPTDVHQDAPPKSVVNEFALPKSQEMVPVYFRGQTYTLQVKVVPQGHAEQTRVLAVLVLGKFVKALFARVPRARQAFKAQAIDLVAPQAPKVTLDLGEVTLYAKAGSTNSELATKMVVDRIVLALMDAQSLDPHVASILKEFHLTTVLKV